MGPDPTTKSRRIPPEANGTNVALIAGAAILLLALLAPLFDPTQLHVQGMFVDQAAYITTARQFLATGELANGVLYPAYVDVPGWRPYMPGHYLALATSFALFGWGTFQALLPSLVGYVIASVCAFLLARRLYGGRAGLVAASLFAFFPANPLYAHTAMAEQTFTAAGALALLCLAAVPGKRRAWLLPLFLLLPFAFRETGALLVLPGAAMVWSGGAKWRVLIASCVGAVLVLYVFNRWQISLGKGGDALSWVSWGGFNYDNALFEPPVMSLGELVRGTMKNAGRNALETWSQLTAAPLRVSVFGVALAAATALLLCLHGARRLRTDPLPLASALLVLGVLTLAYLLYDTKGQKVVRTLLFTTPVLSVAAAGWLARVRPKALGAFLLLYALMGIGVAAKGGAELRAEDQATAEATRLMRELDHDPQKLLIVPFNLLGETVDYVVADYPIDLCLLPANPGTLARVRRRFDLGTLLISTEAFGKGVGAQAQPPETMEGGILRLKRRVLLGGEEYLVYQSP